jgi:hypothetical protein
MRVLLLIAILACTIAISGCGKEREASRAPSPRAAPPADAPDQAAALATCLRPKLAGTDVERDGDQLVLRAASDSTEQYAGLEPIDAIIDVGAAADAARRGLALQRALERFVNPMGTDASTGPTVQAHGGVVIGIATPGARERLLAPIGACAGDPRPLDVPATPDDASPIDLDRVRTCFESRAIDAWHDHVDEPDVLTASATFERPHMLQVEVATEEPLTDGTFAEFDSPEVAKDVRDLFGVAAEGDLDRLDNLLFERYEPSGDGPTAASIVADCGD